MADIVRLQPRAHAAAPSGSEGFSSGSCGGKKSSAVTSPPVTLRMRAATSRPGQDGSSEHRSVTYDGATPISEANSERFIPDRANHSPSLLIETHYSAALKFSQDESFSVALWNVAENRKTLTAMGKTVRSRLKQESVNHFIKEWRKYRRLTQEQLANRVDMSPSSISQLEHGKQDYSQRTLEALADALVCQPGDLLMRNPMDGEAPWSLIDSLKPATKRQAFALLRALKAEDDTEQAA